MQRARVGGHNRGESRVVELEREPATAPSTREIPTRSRHRRLFLGEWTPGDDRFVLDTKAPDAGGVYAFIVDDLVKYVSLTRACLGGRLDGYRRGHERQRTNARVKGLILDALSAGKRVKVLIATPDDHHGARRQSTRQPGSKLG